MAYNGNLPADDGYLSEFPAQQRENQRALKEDKIANAGKLQGLIPGNKSGQIPTNNGALNINLNAEKLGGHAANFFSHDGHKHEKASPSGDGFMSAADKKKLDGVQVGAQVNQNAFSKFKIENAEISADAIQDILTLIAGTNISITPDVTNDKITFSVTGIVDKAKSDKNGKDIAETYLPQNGGTVTGDIKLSNTGAKLAPSSDGALIISNLINAIFPNIWLRGENSGSRIAYREDDGVIDLESHPLRVSHGIISMQPGHANEPAGKSTLVIKKVNKSEAPNNGIVLEYGSKKWTGQLYLSDNATQGIYWNGWSDGVRGTWRKLAFEDSVNTIEIWNVNNVDAWWIKLRGGLIIQGMKAAADTTASFPIQFPNRCLIAVKQLLHEGGNWNQHNMWIGEASIEIPTKTGVYIPRLSGNPSAYVLAIGV